MLLSAILPSQVLQIFEYMNCKAIATRTFFKDQKLFLQPAVMALWTMRQLSILMRQSRIIGHLCLVVMAVLTAQGFLPNMEATQQWIWT